MKRIALITGGLAIAAALSSAAMPAAHADPGVPANCQLIPWGFFGSKQRAICDGAVASDGSWVRRRVVATPEHYVPMTTSCYGSSYVSCTTYGGYVVPFTVNDDETYTVTADTVLPDEPGHLGGSTDGIRHDTNV